MRQCIVSTHVADVMQQFSRTRNLSLGLVHLLEQRPLGCQADVEEFDICLRKAADHLAAIYAFCADERNFREVASED